MGLFWIACVFWFFNLLFYLAHIKLNKFRSLKDEIGDRMVDNFRPTQPVNDRTVFYRSFSVPDIPLSLPHSSTSAVNSYSPFSEAYKWSKAAFKSYATRFLGIFDHPYPHRYNFCRSRPCWLCQFPVSTQLTMYTVIWEPPIIEFQKNIDSNFHFFF